MSQTTPINVFGAVWSYITTGSGSFSQINSLVQLSAAGSAEVASLAGFNLPATGTAVLLNTAGVAFGLGALASDVSDGKGLATYLADTMTIVGDGLAVVGSAIKADPDPRAQALGATLDNWGAATTVAGGLITDYDLITQYSGDSPGLNSLVKGVERTLDGISSAESALTTTFDGVNSALGSAWNTTEQNLAIGLSDVSTLLNDATGAAVSSAANGVVSAFTTFQSSLQSFESADEIAPINGTVAANGSTFTISDADNATPVGDGSITASADGSSATVAFNLANVGNTDSGITFTTTDGLVTGADQENTDGTSQITTYNSIAAVTTYYSESNGTGAITEIDQENTDGTSQITSFGSDGSYNTEDYDGPSGTGFLTQSDQEFADGTSEITTNFADGSALAVDYSGPNGTGAITGITVGGPSLGGTGGTGGDPATPPGGSGGPGGGESNQGTANGQISPLALDLSGTGIDLTALSYTSPYFDLTNDGFARKTGWVGAGTGLLVLPNSNGQVNNITELFGNSSYLPDGFSTLAEYDANDDGVINASDPVFSQLRVWEDTNDNGVVDPGELYALPQLGIVSINLAATAVNATIAGNTVTLISSFTLADGTQHTIADVWFTNSPTFTRPDNPVSVPADIALLPQLNGYGIMYDLQSAMTMDPALEQLVESFVALPATTAPTAIASAVDAIMFEWAGATNGQQSYDLIDPRQETFLADYTGLPLDYAASAAPRQADNVSQGWTDVFDGIEARLVLQTSLSAEVPEFTYDASQDFVLPVTTLYASFASAYARLGDITAANLSSWTLFDQVANAFQMDAHISQSAYEEAIATATYDTIASVANAVANDIQVSLDTDGNIVETGVDLGSIFYAGSGISKLVGEGAGAVPLNAVGWQTTHDIYIFELGDGTVEIDGQGDPNNTSNTLQFGAGILASQIVLSRDSSNDIILTVDSSGDQVTLDDMISRSYDGGLFQITFTDGTSWTAQQLNSMVIATGSPTLTSLVDSLGGATFDPKGYAHYAQGGGGNDKFLYDLGYGNLEIDEEDNTPSPNDTLIFGNGILPSGVTVAGNSDGAIVLTLTDGSQISLDDMWSRSDFGVQKVQFDDGTSWSDQQLLAMETTGSPANTSLYSNHVGSTFDPAGYAHYIDSLSYGSGDTFIYNGGYGNLEISNEEEGTEPEDTLKFGTGILPSDVTVSGSAYGAVVLTLASGSEITLDDMWSRSDFGVQLVQFSDGTNWSAQQILTMETTGSPTNTSLYSNHSGTIFDPAGYAHYIDSLSYGSGDTFIYNIGYGNLEISNEEEGTEPNDVLKFGTGILSSDVTVSAGQYGALLLTLSNGAQITFDHMLSRSDFGIQQVEFADGTSWTVEQVKEMAAITCFVHGTAIMTDRGESAIEELKEGDQVICLDDAARPIKWIGRRYVNCRAHPDPRQVWPIRIRREAFGAGLPHRDLLVSPDHAIYADGVFVLARQLVNGATIFQDRSFISVVYFHIELHQHSIILAENLPVESYLDTGNRTSFDNAGLPTILHPDFSGDARLRGNRIDPYLPLAVDAESVEPIWRQLADRAAIVGFPWAQAGAVTNDAGLRLSVSGRLLRPVTTNGGVCTFVVPRTASCARLISRADAPSDIRPWLDDRRRLGVSVARIIFHGRGDRTEFPVDHPKLTDGWHGPEQDSLRLWRWTDGDAVLSIPAGTAKVEIHLAGTAEYLVTADADWNAAVVAA